PPARRLCRTRAGLRRPGGRNAGYGASSPHPNAPQGAVGNSGARRWGVPPAARPAGGRGRDALRQASPSIFARRSNSEGLGPSTRKSVWARPLLRRATSASRSAGRLSLGCSTVISSENIGRSFPLRGHARSTVKARGPVGRVEDHSFGSARHYVAPARHARATLHSTHKPRVPFGARGLFRATCFC